MKSVAVSPVDPDLVYAGIKPAGLFVSEDGGETWRQSEGFRRIPNRWWWFSPAEPPDFRPYVMAIAPSPTKREVVVAGVEFGAVVRSEDGGQTWSSHRPGALRDCHALKFHALDGERVYEAGGTGGGASMSIDSGRRFRRVTRGLAAPYGISCAADPSDPDVWYTCVAPGPFNAFGEKPEVYLYRSVGGASWEAIGWTAHPLTETPTALVTLPGVPGALIAGTYRGSVWVSGDYGERWEKLPFTMTEIWFGLLAVPVAP